jgi:tetratricopeptide (TPR) repeat protein
MTVSDLSAVPAAVPVIWGNVPQRNKNFTGRTDLLAQLSRDAERRVTAVVQGGDPLPHALQGLGGVGKTAIAIEYAYRHRADYDLVWWIPADEPAQVRASLAALAARLHLEAAASAGIEGAVSAVRDALRRGEPYERWLLIFDNADRPEDLKGIIPDGPGDVMITSRNHQWQSIVDTVQVDVFSRAESTEFLSRRVPKGLADSDAARLAEKLGDLPLALEQAGALLSETVMEAEEYMRLLDEQITKIMAEGKPPDYPLPMTAAWGVSVAILREQLPQALELLRCCAFFGPEPIPRDVFRRVVHATGTSVNDLIADPILLASAVRELGRYALVKLDGGSISVHRLVQALLRDALSPEQRSSYRHEAHLILAAGAPHSPAETQLWPQYAALVAHVAAPVTDLPGCLVPEVRAFVLDVVRYLYNSGDYASCQSFAERFIARWTADSGATDPHVLDAQRHLGNTLRQLGEYARAYEIVQTTMTASSKLLGERDPLTLALRNAFGADLRAHGDFAAAQELDEETRALHEAVFGAADPQTLRVMNNLALDYRLNSDYVAARDLRKAVYQQQSGADSGVSDNEILSSWNGLAWDLRLCGNFAEARDVGQEAVDFGRRRLGSEHLATLDATNGLSIALRRLGARYDEAFELAEQVLEQSRRLFGDRNPVTLAAAINLTNVQRTTGQLAETVAQAESTVASYAKVYGPDHPYNYGCTGNLALLRRGLGDAEVALRLDRGALDGLDRRLTRDHHYSLTVATNEASDLAALGDIAGARALGEETLERSRRVLGETHPMTLGCAANLALDLSADGADAEAERLAAQTAGGYKQTIGSAHPEAQAAAAGQRIDFDFDPPPL